MVADQTKKDRDRSRVADESYEVGYCAKTNGITLEQARELIITHGKDRLALVREATKLRMSNPQAELDRRKQLIAAFHVW
jgi:hypothetical protein